MWLHPDYEARTGRKPPTYGARAQVVEAPEDEGQRLLTLPRSDREGGEQELRVSLDAYQERPYIRLQVWTRNLQTGRWWPCKGRCISVRLKEAADVAEALVAGLRLADRQPRQPQRPQPPARRQPPPNPDLPAPFNECN